MPDLYAGLLILAAAMLAFAWARLRRGERLAPDRALPGGDHLPPVAPPARRRAGRHASLLLPASWPERRRRLAWLGLPVPAAVAASARDRLARLRRGQPDAARPAVPAGALLGGRPGPGLSRSRPARRPAGRSAPQLGRLAPTAQEFLWRPDDSYWSMDLPTRAAVRAEEKAILLRRCWPIPWRQLRGLAGQRALPARPVRARRFRARPRRGGDAPRTTPSSICRGHPPPSGGSPGSRALIYVRPSWLWLAVIVWRLSARRRRSGAVAGLLFVLAAHRPQRRHLRDPVRVRTHAIRPGSSGCYRSWPPGCCSAPRRRSAELAARLRHAAP